MEALLLLFILFLGYFIYDCFFNKEENEKMKKLGEEFAEKEKIRKQKQSEMNARVEIEIKKRRLKEEQYQEILNRRYAIVREIKQKKSLTDLEKQIIETSAQFDGVSKVVEDGCYNDIGSFEVIYMLPKGQGGKAINNAEEHYTLIDSELSRLTDEWDSLNS